MAPTGAVSAPGSIAGLVTAARDVAEAGSVPVAAICDVARVVAGARIGDEVPKSSEKPRRPERKHYYRYIICLYFVLYVIFFYIFIFASFN